VGGVEVFQSLICKIFDHKSEVLFEDFEQIIPADGVTHFQERHVIWHIKKCSRCGKEDWEKIKDESVGKIVERKRGIR